MRTAAFVVYSGFALNWFILAVLYPLPQWAGIYAFYLFAFVSPAFAVLFMALPGRQIGPFLLVYAFVAYVTLNAFQIEPSSYLRFSWPSLLLIASVVPVFSNAPDLGKKLDWYILFLAAVAVVFALGIAVQLEPMPGQFVFRLNYGLFGNLSNPNLISASMLVLAVALLCARREAPQRVHVFAAVGALACGWLIGLCYSYAQVLGSVLVAVAVAGMRRDRNAAVSSGALLVGMALGMLLAWQLSSGDAIKADTTGVRLGIWKAMIDLGMQRPIFGHGFFTDVKVQSISWLGNMETRRFSHNGLVHLFVQGGLVGLLLFVLAAASIGWRIFLHMKAGNPLPLSLAVASIAFFLSITGPLLYWLPAYVLTSAGVFAAAAVPITARSLKDRAFKHRV